MSKIKLRAAWGSLPFVLLAACGGSNEATEENSAPSAILQQSPAVPVFPDPRPSSVEDRMALLALSCVHKEFPNKISHVMQADEDVKPPRELYPAFYGCFDWHSSVHGHWLLTRILKTEPESPLRDDIIEALSQSFTAENISVETDYMTGEGRGSFERPYGLAWFLQLIAELEESDDEQLTEWRETLRPLERAIVNKVKTWLPNLAYPIRLGTHNQSAFGFALMIDYARTVEDPVLEAMLVEKSRTFHLDDVNCPIHYEPSGEDFLSPCLQEADLMRRVMSREEYAIWLRNFLPGIPKDGSADWLEPGIVLDASDGKLVHLDGVNLARAWALEGMAAALPEDDMRIPALRAAADVHREAGVEAISSENYEGSHWLGSFATYLTTERGITGAGAPQ